MESTNVKNKRFHLIFTLVIVAFCLLFILIESLNSKLYTSDFQVYYEAVNDFFSGNNPYVSNYGLDTGYFKYPPFTLYLFSFCVLVPFKVAQGIHLFLLSFSLVISLIIWHKLLLQRMNNGVTKSFKWILYVSFLFIAIHVVRELHLGNINLILLALFSIGSWYYKQKRFWLTVLFFSIMVILKPIAVFIFIPMLIYGQWKIFLGSAAMGIFFFLFPVIRVGWTDNIAIWLHWLKAVNSHGEYLISENSLTYLASYYLGISSQWLFSIIGLILLLACIIYDRLRLEVNGYETIFWATVLLAFTPNFFVTDTEHFLLTLPLIVVFLFFVNTHRSFLNFTLLLLIFLSFSINSNDLMGKNFSTILDEYGILGIGNLVLICSFCTIYLKQKQKSVD